MDWFLPALLGTIGAIGGTLLAPGAGTAAGAEAGAAAGGGAGLLGGAAGGAGLGAAGGGVAGAGMGTGAGIGGGLLGADIAGGGALFGTTAGLGGAGMGTGIGAGLGAGMGASSGALAGAGPAAFGGSSMAYPFTMPGAAASGGSVNPMLLQAGLNMMRQGQQQPMGIAAPPMPVTGRPQNPQLQQQLQMAQGQMPGYARFQPFGFTG